MRVRAAVLTLTLGLLAASVPVEAQQAGKAYRIGILRPAFDPFGSQPQDLLAFFF
ncbi:MAG: hypothetical protein ACE5JD_12810 [Candidatus Methylomirabilia bacterium]